MKITLQSVKLYFFVCVLSKFNINIRYKYLNTIEKHSPNPKRRKIYIFFINCNGNRKERTKGRKKKTKKLRLRKLKILFFNILLKGMWHLARVEILSCFKMNKIAIFVLENKCAHLRVGIFFCFLVFCWWFHIIWCLFVSTICRMYI